MKRETEHEQASLACDVRERERERERTQMHFPFYILSLLSK